MTSCLRSLFLTLSVLLVAILASADSAVLATVGSKKITKDDFIKRYEDIRKRTPNPPTKAEFLEDLVRFELGVQEAEKKNLENDPIVKERMKSEVYKALLEKELSDDVQKIKVTDKEMQTYYKLFPEIRTSHILIEVKPGASAADRSAAEKRAKEIFDEVKKSKRPFEELVKLYSDDVISKENGGDVGWQTRLTLVPSYYNAIKDADTNKMINRLVETQYGFHIVKVTGHRSYIDADKRLLRAATFEMERKKLFDHYFDQLKKKYKISINKESLKE
jgi:parvulin-like peptidyl-prolyl isomerase